MSPDVAISWAEAFGSICRLVAIVAFSIWVVASDDGPFVTWKKSSADGKLIFAGITALALILG